MELPAHLELAPAWRDIRDQLRRAVGDSTYDIWLSGLEVKDWDGQVLVLAAPAATETWVSNRFGRVLEGAVHAVIGSAARVAFAGGGAREARGQRTAAPAAPAPTTVPVAVGLNPRYNFEQFIIGDGNRLAHAAALAVAELPGQAYNPLFLRAPPGLGKTHLLHAIGNYVLAYGAGATVRYTTVEMFTNDFLRSLHAKSIGSFKDAYRNVDVLLIDDVQFLASKVKTEEEFFHTFNAVYETGRQLVLTCDRLPRQLIGVEERLRERFESGLVAEIAPPDFATRLTILRKRAELDRVRSADDAVLELIAERITDNVRALEGALIRIVAQHSLTGHPLDETLARRVLAEMYPGTTAHGTTIDQIHAAVAGFYEISVDELVSPSRKAAISSARQIAIHLCRELTDLPLAAIGHAFGGRNHATVLHACKRVSDRLRDDQRLGGEIDAIRHNLGRAPARDEADRRC